MSRETKVKRVADEIKRLAGLSQKSPKIWREIAELNRQLSLILKALLEAKKRR